MSDQLAKQNSSGRLDRTLLNTTTRFPFSVASTSCLAADISSSVGLAKKLPMQVSKRVRVVGEQQLKGAYLRLWEL